MTLPTLRKEPIDSCSKGLGLRLFGNLTLNVTIDVGGGILDYRNVSSDARLYLSSTRNGFNPLSLSFARSISESVLQTTNLK